jgi:hypothetical protein
MRPATAIGFLAGLAVATYLALLDRAHWDQRINALCIVRDVKADKN